MKCVQLYNECMGLCVPIYGGCRESIDGCMPGCGAEIKIGGQVAEI